MTTMTDAKHPFGELLRQHRLRKPGLSQGRLAELAGYDQAILVRMSQGKKDLTGPSGRERVVRLIETLAEQDALTTQDEANALLLAANMSALFERQPSEAKLMARLAHTQAGHKVRRTNLPAPLTQFIGRAQEIAEVRRLLRATRLLTLIGAGGAGKTRLAQQIAADELINYPNGVWYVELAVLVDVAAIADAVVQALGLIKSDRPAQEQLTDFLSDRHVLLVLDNCEHVIADVATFVLAVLRACPRVSVLATSREALNVEGEQVWRVPPMQVDEAAELFVIRAGAARNDVAISQHDATVAHICQRLDGMPLAIELAAARLQTFGLSDVAARLDQRFSLLTSGRRGALPRHQTLRALMDWSHDLLSEPERVLLRRLGVFVGGWAIEEAECATRDDGLPHSEVLPLLSQLVSKSLVQMDEQVGETRYRLLETVREYALEKLREHGEVEAMRRAHAEAYAQLAERAEMPLRGPQQKTWIGRIAREHANLTTALTWAFGAGGDALIGCRTVSVLKIIWLSSGVSIGASRWIRTAKEAMTEQMPPRVRAALVGLHTGYDYAATIQELTDQWQQALQLYKEANDPIGIADATFNVGSLLLEIDENSERGWQLLRESIKLADAADDMIVGHCARLVFAIWVKIQKRFDEAEVLFRQGIQRCREMNDLANLTKFLSNLGHLYMERMQFREALPIHEEATYVAQQMDSPLDEIFARGHVAELIRFLGDAPRSVEINEEVLAFARERVEPMGLWLPILLLAKSLNDVGEQGRAMPLLHELINIFRRKGVKNPEWYCPTFDAVACVYSGQGDYGRAICMYAASDSIYETLKHRRWLHNEWEYAPYIAKARTALGDVAYAAAYAAGHAMPLDQAIAYALQDK